MAKKIKKKAKQSNWYTHGYASYYDVMSMIQYCSLGESSKRYFELIVNKGNRCAGCGIEGTCFAIVSPPKRADIKQIRLFAFDADGDRVELTIDHIKPTSKKGNNEKKNLQLLCMPCNKLKADQYPFNFKNDCGERSGVLSKTMDKICTKTKPCINETI